MNLSSVGMGNILDCRLIVVMRVPPANISAITPGRCAYSNCGHPAKRSGPSRGANLLTLAGMPLMTVFAVEAIQRVCSSELSFSSVGMPKRKAFLMCKPNAG